MIYHTKPMEVRAHEWVPSDEDSRLLLFARLVALGAEPVVHGGEHNTAPLMSFWCEKSHRYLTVAPGDYLIEEADGIGVYPCVRAEFERKYELAEPEVDVAKAMASTRGIHPVSRGTVLETAQGALAVESGL